MQKRIIQAGLQGMNQDVINPNVNSKQAYEIKNFRLNATANSNAIELTTEKGTMRVLVEDMNGNPFSVPMFEENDYTIIGHCAVNEHLVIFMKGNGDNLDRVMHFVLSEREDGTPFFYEDDFGSYLGNLNFDTNHKIEAIPCYESEDVIKVYWIDGINYPRVINLKHNYGYTNDPDDALDYDPFSFYQEISSGSYNTIDVQKTYVGGLFYAGVIQYAFSFYNRNAQETPIVYTTPLNYVSHSDRGEVANKQLGCAFNLTVKINPEDHDRFEYVRIYQIYRTSLNVTPVVKVIKDIKTGSLEQNTGYYSAQFTDTNEYGYDFDAYKILVNNEYIKPNAIAFKDQKLFLGNYKSDFDHIPNDTFVDAYGNDIQWTGQKIIDVGSGQQSGYYKYKNQNQGNSEQVRIFKHNEWYKFGLQFQDVYGKWTQPYYVCTLQNTEDIDTVDNKKSFGIPVYQYTMQQIRNKLGSHKDNYVSVRPVVSYPTKSERSVLCQGILNPTVFNSKQRKDGTCHAQASWFFRPFNNCTDANTDTTGHVMKFAESRHFKPCGHSVNDSGTFIGELQNMYFSSPTRPFSQYQEGNEQMDARYDSFYYVNYDCVTINSPEIESDEFVHNTDLSQYSIKVVGRIKFKNVGSKYMLVAESPLFLNTQKVTGQTSRYIRSSKRAFGFYDRTYEYFTGDQYTGGRLLQTCSCWFDDVSQIFKKDDYAIVWNKDKDELAYAVYPWQRQYLNNFGSNSEVSFENDDYGVTDDENSSKILKKVLSNSRWCDTEYYSTQDETDLSGVNDIKLFKSNENQLLSVNQNYYYGNVDQLVTCTSLYNGNEFYGPSGNTLDMKWIDGIHKGYPILIDKRRYTLGTPQSGDDRYEQIEVDGSYTLLDLAYPVTLAQQYGDSVPVNVNPTPYVSSTDPIMIRYKSTPHIVCSINSQNISQFQIDNIPTGTSYCYIVDVYKDISDGPYVNDNDNDTLMQRTWVPCGKAHNLNSTNQNERISWDEGDAYYMRYDCLKTYPFSEEDYQSVVEIASFPVETHINLDGRYDNNRGLVDNTFISPVNFNLINPVYSQENNFFQYNILDEDSYRNTKFPTRFTWPLNKINDQEIDEWTRTNTAAFYDCDGDKGAITSLRRFRNQIYAFQDRGISRIKYNENVAISAQNGTPIELANSQTVNGVEYISETVGSQNKWSNISTPNGIFFVDNYTPGIYRLGGGESVMSNLTKNCMQRWFESRNNAQDYFISDAWYDSNMNEVMFMFADDDNTKKSVAFNCDYNVFSSFYDYKGRIGNIHSHSFNIYGNNIHFLREGNTYNTFYGSGPSKYWISFVANAYVDGYSPSNAIYDNVWYKADVLHYYDDKDTFNYGELIPETDDKIYDFTKTTGWYETFNKIVVGNDYQYAENKDQTKCFDFIKKFRTWRVPVPRQSKIDGRVGRERMRNSWLRIKLENTSPSTDKMVLRDIYVDSFY